MMILNCRGHWTKIWIFLQKKISTLVLTEFHSVLCYAVFCFIYFIWDQHLNQYFPLSCRKNGMCLLILLSLCICVCVRKMRKSKYESYHSQCMCHRFFLLVQPDHVSDRTWCKRNNNRIISGFRRFIIYTSFSLISLFRYLRYKNDSHQSVLRILSTASMRKIFVSSSMNEIYEIMFQYSFQDTLTKHNSTEFHFVEKSRDDDE